MRCFFGNMGGCSGPSDRAHWIPKARLRREGLDEHAVWDKRSWAIMCRRHHHQLDMKQIRLPLEAYPATFLEYAAEHNLYWAGERDGWRFERAKVAR